MKQLKPKNENNSKATRKSVVGVRCYPENKLKLSAEAKNLGLTLSEHCENILLNNESLFSEKKNADLDLELCKQKIHALEIENETKLTILLNENDKIIKEVELYKEKINQMEIDFEIKKLKLENLNDNLKKEAELKMNELEFQILKNNSLNKKIKFLEQKTSLFTNGQLLLLFKNLKGKSDTINGSDGNTYHIIYENPEDVLKAMIYSFKIKNT